MQVDWALVYKHVPILTQNMEEYVQQALDAQHLGDFTPRLKVPY